MNSLSTPKLPKRLAGLDELAHNLWWSWHHEARELFKALDRPLWKVASHNPVKLLRQIAAHRLVAAAQDPGFLRRYDAVMNCFKADMAEEHTWFHSEYPRLGEDTIAYFSMEFALHNSLPIYAGGLGVLAGDYCKEASDLGLPMVGVGFMYPQGYFQQRVSDDGWQEEVYRPLDFNAAPIKPALSAEGQAVKVPVGLDSRSVMVSVWQVDVGRVRLYLLDTDIVENPESDRKLTARLYGGDRAMRLQQEIILGIGGVRALRALGIQPVVWHANEGHTVFMMLERCRELVAEGMGFAEAVEKVRATSVFTTHTPVPAGNDAFPHSLMEKYFHGYWGTLGLEREAFLKLGTVDSDNASFNMTVLGLHMSRQSNGVSELHGAVCRQMWHCLWPECPEKDVPIGVVTNGVHVPTWVAPQMAKLYEKYLGADWWARHDDPALWEQVEEVPDAEIWASHRWLKTKLTGLLRERARKRWADRGGSPLSALAMGSLLDAEALTIGFSRRFTDYKRAFLILRDSERLKRLVQDDLRPVQIVFSGKAHPNDEHGKQLIQEVYRIAQNPEFRGRIAFVEDYDMHLARYLVTGVDVWLNTPRTFQEASGTSGMKAGVNGVPHLSVLDGWWREGYNGANGWAIDNEVGGGDVAAQDSADAGTLYHLLEEKIVPLYYDREMDGIPHGWVQVMKQAIRSIVPVFSARRMVKEYARQCYVPASRSGESILPTRTGDNQVGRPAERPAKKSAVPVKRA